MSQLLSELHILCKNPFLHKNPFSYNFLSYSVIYIIKCYFWVLCQISVVIFKLAKFKYLVISLREAYENNITRVLHIQNWLSVVFITEVDYGWLYISRLNFLTWIPWKYCLITFWYWMLLQRNLKSSYLFSLYTEWLGNRSSRARNFR